MPRYVLFGDESTLPEMCYALGDSVAGVVVASNRPQAMEVRERLGPGGNVMMQPPSSSPQSAAFLDAVRALRPDYFLCFSYSMLLSADLLQVPRSGALNVHGGLLPEYRGANVLNWVLVEGAAETGVTLHYMTPGVDDGDVVMQERVQICETDTAATLKARLDAIGFRMLREASRMLTRGETLPRRPQDAARARYYKRRCPEDGRIDWSRSDREIFDLIRALVAPWPGAFFFDRSGRKIVVDRYCSLEEVARLRARYGS